MGAISLHDIKNYLNAPELAALIIAGDRVPEPFSVVPPEVSLTEAFDRFVDHDRERLSVVSNSARHRPIGSISKTDLILALAGRDPI